MGYAGVIGADRLLEGEHLYGGFPPGSRTATPTARCSTRPSFRGRCSWPWSGTWDGLPAAHAAAVAFDLACVAGLWLAGRRLRGPSFGLLLAYLWVTFPFTLLVANSSANDALVGALVLAALLCAGRPAARGALAVLAGLTKFAPLALVPLVRHRGAAAAAQRARRARRRAARHGPGRASATGSGRSPTARSASRASGSRRSRSGACTTCRTDCGWPRRSRRRRSPSRWRSCPRRRDDVTIAALGAAVLIALQLALEHWFYLYVVWFLPLLLIALLTPAVAAGSARSPSPGRRPRSGSAPR